MRALLLVPLLAACGGAPAHPRADDLVACWRTAVGGERLSRLRSIEREATIEADGLTGTQHTWARSDGAYREDSTIGPSSSVVVFDGTRAWWRDGFGAPLALARTELANVKTTAYLERLGQLTDPAHGHVRAGPRDHTLIVAADGGRDELITLDPASCLPRTGEHTSDDIRVVATYTGWTRVDGVQLPGQIAIESSRGDKQHVSYTTTRLDASIDPAQLAALTVDPRARVPRLTAPVTIPAQLTQNHVYVDAKINGKGPVALLVDTGAGGLLLDLERAKQLGLSGTGKVPLRGAGAGQLDAEVIAAPTVGLAGVELAVEAAHLAPFAALSHYEGRPIEGIVGYEVLSHYVAEFDYATPALRLHDAASFAPPDDAIALPFYTYDTKPMIELAIELADGRRFPVQALVDTGNRGALSITTAFVQRHHLLAGAGPLLRAPLGFGVGGRTKQALGRVTLHVGALAIPDVLTSFSEDDHGADASDQAVQVNLGSGVMKQFTLWVDYPHARLYLRKNARFGTPTSYDASGLSLEAPDDAFQRAVVKTVLPGSPAATAGIAADDELIAIDGEPVAKLGLEAVRARLSVADRRLRVELARGRQRRTVELATRRLI